MAERKARANKTDAKNETTKKVAKVEDGAFKILRAKEFTNGGISFDMEFRGMTFYRLGVRSGKNGDFISYPSYKGTDGNYYHYYYIPLDDEGQDAIIQAVYNVLDSEPEVE